EHLNPIIQAAHHVGGELLLIGNEDPDFHRHILPRHLSRECWGYASPSAAIRKVIDRRPIRRRHSTFLVDRIFAFAGSQIKLMTAKPFQGTRHAPE
ncbi:MAG: hypothetical protein OEM91_14570, partial [Hyphomicrobiales bacterium]|nr:hypothetical protein [Hyphomicrobiales bacterium]